MAQHNQNQPQLHVVFRSEPIINEAKSKKAGRPIYDDVEVCQIYFPGDRQRSPVFPAHQAQPDATRLAGKPGTDYARFMPGEKVTYAMLYNDQYMAFKNHSGTPTTGTPLSELTFLTEGKRLELRALNVHTAETLAALDGQALKNLGMGARELKNAAQKYIDAAAGSADVVGLARENAELKGRLDALAQDHADLVASLKAKNTTVREPAQETDEDHDFENWDDERLKEFFVAETGARPKGTPSHTTLVNSAYELVGKPSPLADDSQTEAA